MATFTNIDGEEPSTVTFTVAAVQLTRNSSAELQEIVCLGDPENAASILRVSSVAPRSTDAAVAVRLAGGPSSVVDCAVRAVLPSTATDNPVSAAQASTVWAVQVDGRVRAQNSTIGDFLASVQQNSTVWAVQVDGRVRAQNSTIGDLLASVQQNSTVWQTQAAVRTSSGGGVEGSTDTPAQAVLGLHVRVAPSSMQTFAASTIGANSTGSTLVSSAANQVISVYAFTVTSTVITPSTVSFRSSNAAVKWPLALGSASSGVTGANLAVNPPAFLFQTAAGDPLIFHTPSAGPEFHVAVSYFVR